MRFDENVWQKPAIQGDVAGIALFASLAIRNLNLAIMKIQSGEDPEEEIKAAGEMAEELQKVFNDMTGRTSDAE